MLIAVMITAAAAAGCGSSRAAAGSRRPSKTGEVIP
jgi:hypothetical protein